jgi:hypothetical protein
MKTIAGILRELVVRTVEKLGPLLILFGPPARSR